MTFEVPPLPNPFSRQSGHRYNLIRASNAEWIFRRLGSESGAVERRPSSVLSRSFTTVPAHGTAIDLIRWPGPVTGGNWQQVDNVLNDLASSVHRAYSSMVLEFANRADRSIEIKVHYQFEYRQGGSWQLIAARTVDNNDPPRPEIEAAYDAWVLGNQPQPTVIDFIAGIFRPLSDFFNGVHDVIVETGKTKIELEIPPSVDILRKANVYVSHEDENGNLVDDGTYEANDPNNLVVDIPDADLVDNQEYVVRVEYEYVDGSTVTTRGTKVTKGSNVFTKDYDHDPIEPKDGDFATRVSYGSNYINAGVPDINEGLSIPDASQEVD